MSEEQDPRDWSKIAGVILRLVRAPITFGHTQLLMEHGDKSKADGQAFYDAAGAIRSAIDTMHTCLKPERLKKFPVLATVTHTERDLIKVLILRASASEEPGVFKVHLVPYFQSHHEACLKRFEERHQAPPGAPGGLLGWLGEQEDKVDKWEVDFPREDKLNQWANETLRLIELAKNLRTAWDSLNPNNNKTP